MKRLYMIFGVGVLVTAVAMQAQIFRGRWGMPIYQNEPPNTDFVIARWKYSNNGRIDGAGWSHDYPQAEQHISQILSEVTLINIERMSYKIVELADDEIFKYPFVYLSEPGEMELTPEEDENFRQYVDRGGFIMIDDFDGRAQLENLLRNLRRVFPDREVFRLTIDHEIFQVYFDIDALQVISPYNVGADAVFWGMNNKDGRLAIIMCHNNDVGTFWGDIDLASRPLKPSIESLRLGIDFALYALTH
jgi:Domain of unknown function (DUF4159)